MTSWATSGQVKIDRAKEHIRDLEGRATAFFDPPPFKIVRVSIGADGTSLLRWRRLPGAKDIDPIVGAIVGDVVHNLRSALDVLWRQATNPRPGKSDKRKGAFFPCEETFHESQERMHKIKKEPAMKAAFKIACDIKWQKAGEGSRDLWRLHQASLLDKHEVPAVVLGALQKAMIPLQGQGGALFLGGSLGRLVPVEDGKPIYWTITNGLSPEPSAQDQISFAFGFGEFGPLTGQAVLPMLHKFAKIVQQTADAFLLAKLLP